MPHAKPMNDSLRMIHWNLQHLVTNPKGEVLDGLSNQGERDMIGGIDVTSLD